MKQFIALILILLPMISHSAPENVRAVKELVELYQAEAQKQTGNYIRVIFDPAESYQANAKIYPDGAVIKIYSLLVKEFEPLELVTIACHELGHILGEIRHANNRIGEGVQHFHEAIEGEADYFAGSCLRSYMETTNSTKVPAEIAAKSYQKLHHLNSPIDASQAEGKSIKGILVGYPDPACRLLSVLNGIENKERPQCWYNP